MKVGEHDHADDEEGWEVVVENDPNHWNSQLTQVLTVPSVLEVARATVGAQLGQTWTNLQVLLGVSQPKFLTMAELDPSPSDATVRVVQLASQLVPPCIVNHMVRTYYFAMAIHHFKGTLRIAAKGSNNNKDGFDREAFWVACLLHDVGISEELTPPVSNDTAVTAATFFEIRGARRAHTFCQSELDAPFAHKRAYLVHEAIALHTSVAEFGKHCSAEKYQWAKMLFDGASTDLVAKQLGYMAPETIGEILKRYPKLDLHATFEQIMTAEALAQPNSTIAAHDKIGLLQMIGASGSKFSKYEKGSVAQEDAPCSCMSAFGKQHKERLFS